MTPESIPATLMPGDGIGPEISAAVVEILDAIASSPDIAGKGIANPLALLLAAAMILDHVGRNDAALKLRGAIDGALRDDGLRTGDLGGNATTLDMTQAIVRRVSKT